MKTETTTKTSSKKLSIVGSTDITQILHRDHQKVAEMFFQYSELEDDDYETKWTRGAMARNAFGHSCSAWDKEAVRFCAVGAIYRAAFDILGESLDSIIIEITETCVLAANGLEHSSIPSVNDHEGWDAVQAMFQKALVA